jgi:hypothetical protein
VELAFAMLPARQILVSSFLFAVSFSVLIRPHEEKSFIAHIRQHNLFYTGEEYRFCLNVFLANAR